MIHVVVCHWLGQEHQECSFEYSRASVARERRLKGHLEKKGSPTLDVSGSDKLQPVPIALETHELISCYMHWAHQSVCWGLLVFKQGAEQALHSVILSSVDIEFLFKEEDRKGRQKKVVHMHSKRLQRCHQVKACYLAKMWKSICSRH